MQGLCCCEGGKKSCLEGLGVQNAAWVCDKKGCGFTWTGLKQGGGRTGLTHTDETTRGSGLREQEVWKYVPSAGKERWKTQRCQMSNES